MNLMDNGMLSRERKQYLKALRLRKGAVISLRAALLVCIVALWEIFARLGVIDSFIMSSPWRIWETMRELSLGGELWRHVWVTVQETLVGFSAGVAIGFVIACLLWWSPFWTEITEPYWVVLNSLPKIALGPVIIILVGAGTKAIIFMAIAISLVVTILEMLGGFLRTDRDIIAMARSFSASKWQVFCKIVLPFNLPTLFNLLKVNIGLSLVGVIAGEFLVSKAGLGYLIVYGGQVFQMDLVMAGVIILAVLAAALYFVIAGLEKLFYRGFRHSKS